MTRPIEPFDELPAELQAEVAGTAQQVIHLGGERRGRPGGGVLRQVDQLSQDLYTAFSPGRRLHSSAQVAGALERVRETRRHLDEIALGLRAGLETADDLLSGLRARFEEHERQLAEEAEDEAAQRRIDAEVDRLDEAERTAEESARRARLEEQAREKLAARS